MLMLKSMHMGELPLSDYSAVRTCFPHEWICDGRIALNPVAKSPHRQFSHCAGHWFIEQPMTKYSLWFRAILTASMLIMLNASRAGSSELAFDKASAAAATCRLSL